jgi:hypothetical protein
VRQNEANRVKDMNFNNSKKNKNSYQVDLLVGTIKAGVGFQA